MTFGTIYLIVLEFADGLSGGQMSSSEVIKELQRRRRSKYAPLFPSNSAEFKKTKQELQQEYMQEIMQEVYKKYPHLRKTEDGRTFLGK